MSMIRKTLFQCFASAVCWFWERPRMPIRLRRSKTGEQGNQSQQAVKSVSGKVAAIGTGGTAFTLEVSGENKKTMDFVVDKNTQVQGQVRAGSAVTVEYQAIETGQYLAVSVTAQG